MRKKEINQHDSYMTNLISKSLQPHILFYFIYDFNSLTCNDTIPLFKQFRVVGVLVTIQADSGRRQGSPWIGHHIITCRDGKPFTLTLTHRSHFRVSNEPKLYVFGLWDEAGEPVRKPRCHGENVQTPHRRTTRDRGIDSTIFKYMFLYHPYNNSLYPVVLQLNNYMSIRS